MNAFCDSSFKSLVKKTCFFQNPENAYYTNLMLLSSSNSFQNSCAINTGLSDFHKITATILKIKFEKLKPRILHYRNYKTKTLPNYKFEEYLLSKLPIECISPSKQGFPHRVSW